MAPRTSTGSPPATFPRLVLGLTRDGSPCGASQRWGGAWGTPGACATGRQRSRTDCSGKLDSSVNLGKRQGPGVLNEPFLISHGSVDVGPTVDSPASSVPRAMCRTAWSNPLADNFNVFQVEPTPVDAVVADPEDGDPAHVEPCPIGAGACQCHSAHSVSPWLARRSSSAWKSGTPAKTSAQFFRACSLPTNARSGCTGCSLRYCGSKQATKASRSWLFWASRSRSSTSGTKLARLPGSVASA
jgi:hypothetical protein